ncbi:MAG: OmpA family protein [Myxococcota bacterium]
MNRLLDRRIWLLCGVFVVAVAGCPKRPPSSSLLCKKDADCVWTLADGTQQPGFCVAGQCQLSQQCTSDADCAAGSICWQQRCRTLCEPGEEGGSNCPEGFVCTLQGFCAQLSETCQQHSDCPQQQRCEAGLCVADMQPSGQDSSEIDLAMQECLQPKQVFFEFDQSLLREADLAVLQHIAACATKYDLTVTIEAHTDHWGSAQYNMALADQRGQAVRAYLQPLVAGNSMQVISFGSRDPLRPECSRQACSQRKCNVNEEACAQNRRCNIVLQLSGSDG